MIYAPGTQITFKSVHGQVITGNVYSSNDEAIMVTCELGVFVIAHSQVICYDKMIKMRDDTYEDWSNYSYTFEEDDETF